MSAIKQMYQLLEDMVEAAEKGNQDRVLELNELYLKLIPKVHEPMTELDLEYDSCRNSCVMAVSMPSMYEELISDARDRFSKISKPE